MSDTCKYWLVLFAALLLGLLASAWVETFEREAERAEFMREGR